MASQTWPIRVGGIYKSQAHPKEIAKRVIRVHGEQVYFESWYLGEDKPFSGGDLGADYFRALVLPEDQSPIPDLLAALKACQLQMLQSNNQTEYAQEANELAIAAIAKAEGR